MASKVGNSALVANMEVDYVIVYRFTDSGKKCR